jgi:hypothetical protein
MCHKGRRGILVQTKKHKAVSSSTKLASFLEERDSVRENELTR